VGRVRLTHHRVPSTPEAIHHPASTEPRTASEGSFGPFLGDALLLSSSSRGAQRDGRAEAREDRSFHSRLGAGGALPARRYRITDSMKSGYSTVLLLEEPHLRATRGQAYEECCRAAPRRLGAPQRRRKTEAAG
jgi:hypothetical protein